MRIALAHRQLEPKGGTERVLYRTAEGLRDRGHEVHLFCGVFRIPPPPGVDAHRVPCLPWPRTLRLLSFAFTAPRVMARYQCDVVVSFTRMVKQDIFRSGGGPHLAFIEKMMSNSGILRRIWYRLSPYHQCVLAIERRQLSSEGCRKVITVSQQGKQEMLEYYQLPEEKLVVIYNGVDHLRFHPSRRLNEGKRIRKELRIPDDKAVVLFVGTGFRRKGLDRLLRLWSDDGLAGIDLLVVGDDAKLTHYKNRWNQKDIFFVGPRSNVEDYYAAADLLVLPSIQEAFGNVVLEALASGLPIVTIPGVGVTTEIEGDLRKGILINPDDPEELKKRILWLLDRNRWENLSKTARKFAEKYSWETYLTELEKQVFEVTGHNGDPAYQN